MMRLIECRSCDSPSCEGCNVYILKKMLRAGELDCLMDEHRTIVRSPKTLRPTGKWSFGEILDIDWYSNVPAWFCSNCGSHIVDKSRKPRVPNMKYCHNCGCKMENVQ